MKQQRLTIIAVIFSLAVTAGAQDAPCEQRILVPVIADGVPGAFGSIWQTYLTISNRGEEPVFVGGIFRDCGLPPCPTATVEPGSTAIPSFHDEYLTVLGCDAIENIDINLRVRDLSREKETWGTSIPVVYEDDVFHEPFGITDIRNGDGFRSMLRIYTFERGVTTSARVKVYAILPNRELNDDDTDVLLTDFPVTLTPVPLDPFHTPGYAQISLPALQELEGWDQLRVEISGEESVGLWAFVSTTSNDNQFVTVLTPR
ncbi:MAG: hypothetical protein KY459_03545 [Acidobacteria bacterium]|nr:hypothetical protein [Acidobacteriota bacterium]